MRNAHLLSTVAAALLMSAGLASAQSMQTQAPARAPAAQQNAPAEKSAPGIHRGAVKSERKGSETTGQASQEGREGLKGRAADHPMRVEKNEHKGPATIGQSPSERSRTTNERSSERKSTTTTGQGAAAGRAKLSSEQRTKITSVIKRQNVRRVERTSLNVSLNIGTRIPASASVHFYPLPAEVVTVYPQWRGYDYILVGEEIVIIEPSTHEIVYIIES